MGLVCSCSCGPPSRNGPDNQKGSSLLPMNEIDQPKKAQKHGSHKLQDKGVSKIREKSLILGRSGTLNLKKAVDKVGRRFSRLKSGKEFVVSRGTKISVLSFEVANTIEKGRNLLESLSERKFGVLKEVLGSEGVQNLVSTDMNTLLMIAAADRREEFDVFLKEVVRFGDLCKDPKWHNLGQSFPKSDTSDDSSRNIFKEEVEATMRELRVVARHTLELYHESNALDRFEHDYKEKIEEAKSFNLPRRGEDLAVLHEEVKLQRKIVNSLKKKSVWSNNMEEIVPKLVDVLAYINQQFVEASGNNNGTRENANEDRTSGRLGPAGLALHYANIIIQIDTIASRPTCLPLNVRDSLYRSLPRGVKTALHSRLRVAGEDAQLVVSRVRAEMAKTSKWLVPAAMNTIKVHKKFGWVGEWAMSSKDKKTVRETIRLQTLHHADKEKTEIYILEQVTWLHHLIKLAKQQVNAIVPLPLESSANRNPYLLPKAPQFPPVVYTALKSMNTYKVSQVSPLTRSSQSSPSIK